MNAPEFHEFFYDASLDENPDPALQVWPPVRTPISTPITGSIDFQRLWRERRTPYQELLQTPHAYPNGFPATRMTVRGLDETHRPLPRAIRIGDAISKVIVVGLAVGFVWICWHAVATGAVARLVAR